MITSYREAARGLVLAAMAVFGGCAATAALAWAVPGPPPRHPHPLSQWLGTAPPEALVSVALAVVAELTIWWLVLGTLTTLIGYVPGAVGEVAAAVAARVTPGRLRRCVEAAIGAGVVAATVLLPATGTYAATATSPVATAAMTVPPPGIDRFDLDRPSGGTFDLDRPTPRDPAWRPPAPSEAPPQRIQVTVREGDSLWAIAARTLGPAATTADVAAAWPRWYAANRSVIGPDPGRLLPGQILIAPDA